MTRVSCVLLFSLSLPTYAARSQLTPTRKSPAATSAIAFANFAPINTDVFVANADGGDARPLLTIMCDGNLLSIGVPDAATTDLLSQSSISELLI